MLITAEELLAGNDAVTDVSIPRELLAQSSESRTIRLRPLTVRDIQVISKAARNDEVLTSALMIQQAVVEPKLKQQDISAMRGGLVRFLVDHINRISGLTTTEDDLRALADSPLGQAYFVLAREFQWTPEQVRELTVGQILGYLDMLNRTKGAA